MYGQNPIKNMEDDDVEKYVQYITSYTSIPLMTESRIVCYNSATKKFIGFTIVMMMISALMFTNISIIFLTFLFFTVLNKISR